MRVRVNPAAFSRPRESTGFGKNMVPAKTMLAPETREKLDEKIKADGFRDRAEWLRYICICKAHGVDTLRSVNERRIESVAEMVPEKAPE